MEVAGFIISIFALVIGILALVLSMRALYIIGVNAGLDKQFDPKANTVPTPSVVKIETLLRQAQNNVQMHSAALHLEKCRTTRGRSPSRARR